jgi:hypothetical protein
MIVPHEHAQKKGTRAIAVECCNCVAAAQKRSLRCGRFAFHFALVRTPPFNKNIDTT